MIDWDNLETMPEDEIPYNVAALNWMISKGYDIRPLAKANTMIPKNMSDLTLGYELFKIENNELMASIVDCIYTYAITFFRRKVEEYTGETFVYTYGQGSAVNQGTA